MKDMETKENYTELSETIADSGTETNLNTDAAEPVQADGSTDAVSRNAAWGFVAIGGVAGLALGTAASCAFSAKAETAEAETEAETAEGAGKTAASPLIDQSVSVSAAVGDDMTFAEAFAAARAEVGAGGVFEWHGNLYSTYYVEEWNAMSDSDRAEYNSHFAWSDAASSSQGAGEEAHKDEAVAEVVPQEEPKTQVEVEPEVELLGVAHDAETGANYAGITIDGQEAVLIDIDGNHLFDIGVSDLNGDGYIQQEEVVDISGEGITVEGLGGFTYGAPDMCGGDGMDAGDGDLGLYSV